MANYVGVSTGISLHQEVIDAMRQMKRNNAFRWMSLKISPAGNTVVLDTTSKPKYTKQNTNSNKPPSKKPSPQDIGIGGEPLIEVLGNLDIQQLESATHVCQHWKQIVSSNEERLLHRSAISTSLCTPSFDIKQYGFDTWKEYLLEQYVLHYPPTMLIRL